MRFSNLKENAKVLSSIILLSKIKLPAKECIFYLIAISSTVTTESQSNLKAS